jgi:soluble lytic murein transglycosylase-like protein
VKRRIATVSLSLLAWQATPALPASAAERAVPTTAVVDESGRVVPVRPDAATPQVIRRPAAPPCAEAAALPEGAAKDLVARIAAEEGFYPDFVLSVAKIESRYVSTALSEKGAYGLMQLEPDRAKRFNVDLCKPEDNVRGGIRYLRVLHARYRNPFFILAAYNAGEDAVRRSRGVPPFPETVRFVADVMNDFYTWPDPAQGQKGSAAMAAAATPGIVEVDPASGLLATNARPESPAPAPRTNAPEAPPAWSGGFVLHVD